MLVPREHEIDLRALECLERVAGVIDHVPLAPGTWNGQQVVMEDEDPEVRRVGELLRDPAVTAPADVPVVEVRLGGVDRDHETTFW